MLMRTRGNRLIGANRAAIYVNLLPLFGATLAVLLLGVVKGDAGGDFPPENSRC